VAVSKMMVEGGGQSGWGQHRDQVAMYDVKHFTANWSN